MGWKTKLVTASVLLALAYVPITLGHESATGIVAERMELMKTMGRELKAIADMLTSSSQVDTVLARKHAEAFHESCHQVGALFPSGVDHHSRARPEIWQKPEAFAAELHRLHQASAALIQAVATGDKGVVRTSVGQVQGTCNSCHEKFRVPDS
jgi:cytochrome c556